jgi:hypothetical protein
MTTEGTIPQTVTQESQDVQAIRNALMRYCRGVDRCDADLITSAYHPDATDEHGSKTFTGQTVGQGLVDLTASSRVSSHQVTNQLIELTGTDSAGSETYYTAWQTLDRDGQEFLMLSLGRYLDKFERRNGEWKIAHRLVVVELTHLVPSAGPMEPSRPGLASRSRNDPSYEVLPRSG